VEACDGVRRARESRPAVILMDLNMPRLDGCSAIARLRCDESTENIPVIVLTREHESSMLDRARLAATCQRRGCSASLCASHHQKTRRVWYSSCSANEKAFARET
jgi:CheY-like chemotaxis protein